MQMTKIDEGGARRMVTIEEVLEIVPVTRGTLARMEKAGKFPKSHYISENRRVWFLDEIIRGSSSAATSAGAVGSSESGRRPSAPLVTTIRFLAGFQPFSTGFSNSS